MKGCVHMSFKDDFLSGFNDFLGKTKNPKGITRDSVLSLTNESDKIFRFTEIYKFFYAEDKSNQQFLFKAINLADNEVRFVEFMGEDTRIYEVFDRVPFSEEFLDMVGQLYFNTPDNTEYVRSIAASNTDRIDSLVVKTDCYNLKTGKTITRNLEIMCYDINIFPEEREGYIYSDTECLQFEMDKEDGMFTILRGYKIDDFMYKILKSSDDNTLENKV